VRAGQLRADPGTAEPFDRLEIQALGVLVAAEQCPGPGLDPERPVGGGGGGGLRKPSQGTGRTLNGSGPGRRLDQLGQRPGSQPQLIRVGAGLLGCGQRLVIAAQAVVEHRGGPGGGGQPLPVTVHRRVCRVGGD
jgi:hypothetical protein